MDAEKVFHAIVTRGVYAEYVSPPGINRQAPRYEVTDANGTLYAHADNMNDAITKAWSRLEKSLKCEERQVNKT